MFNVELRGWHKRKKKMIYDFDASYTSGEEFDGGFWEVTLPDRSCPNVPENVELMLFTGLKDKNKIKIFENDIVKRYDRNDTFHKCVVVWDDKIFAFGLKSESNNIQLLSDFYKQNGTELEVIGHTYE